MIGVRTSEGVCDESNRSQVSERGSDDLCELCYMSGDCMKVRAFLFTI